ncbi:MAG: peptidylprolyl isomerase, partial [Novosphingobium sp.]
EIKTTAPLTANGAVYGKNGETGPAILAKALSTAFTMEEGEPQIAEIDPGKTFLIFDVAEIVQSAPAPLKDIKNDVTEAWVFAQGSAEARKAADRVLAKVAKGTSLTAALAAEKKPLPPADKVNLGLDDLRKMGQRPPAPIVLLFSMAQGSTKRLEGPDDRGWFIVQLDKITEGKLEKDDPALAMTRQQLAQSISDEYSEQLVKAIRKDVGVARNEAGITAVRRQLSGE